VISAGVILLAALAIISIGGMAFAVTLRHHQERR
jgi:uncharacterized membrane protein SpoIIM required for sporulation